MNGVRLLVGFIGVAWILGGLGTGLTVLDAETEVVMSTWSRVGPFLGAVLGVVLLFVAIGLGFLGQTAQWTPPVGTATEPALESSAPRTPKQ